MPKGNQPNVVYVERKNNGCLINALIFVLFGWIGLAFVALWAATKWLWRWCVVFPSVWLWRIGLQYPLVWTWKGSAAGVRAIRERLASR